MLDLDVADVRRLQVRRVEAGRVVDLRASKDVEGHQQVVRAVTPVRASKGLKEFEVSPKLVNNPIGMGTEGERAIEREPQNRRVCGKGQELAVEENLRMMLSLVGVSCEEGDRRLFRRDRQVFPLCPLGNLGWSMTVYKPVTSALTTMLPSVISTFSIFRTKSVVSLT